MDRVYNDTPDNFMEIEPYIVRDKESVGKEIILSGKCYFYDTCAFRNHMTASEKELLLQYMRQTSGIVIITRTILMELCSRDGCLWKEHMEYIKSMHLAGIKVLVIYEEELFDVLHTFCADVAEINKWLSFAVRCAKSKVGKVELMLGQDAILKRAVLEGATCGDSKLAEKLFGSIRKQKTAGDNMGEELLAICVHWLSRMRDAEPCKYIILTDDKKAIPRFGKVIRNVKEYSGSSSVSVFTTVKLCYLMRTVHVIEEEKQVAGILSGSNLGNHIKVFCSEEYELEPTEKLMSISEFTEKIMEGTIKVYY